MSPHKIDLLPSPSALASYGITQNGFLPAKPPLQHLPDIYYKPWEDIVCQLPDLLKTGRLRELVDIMPTLNTSRLSCERQWQRAYSMLAVMAQAYIWQGPKPSDRLPPSISIPFLKTSEHLEVHPIATYAALNLWNWRTTHEDADQTRPDNMESLHTLTGTDDESWFFVISNAMEARAGPIIRMALEAIEAVDQNDALTVIDTLKYLHQSIVDISRLLERMDERCRPQTFYHKIRPFLAGSMNMEAAGLSNGVFYDEGDRRGSWRRYRGGSNGQSSLLQFFDAVLGVTHGRCGGFHAEMREYMPGAHARFLRDIEAIANIREYVEKNQENAELLAAYNEAVASLSGFRDTHIQLVTRYIILPSRMSNSQPEPGHMNLASSSKKLVSENNSTNGLVGTGGTKLIPFLRTSRDETGEASIAHETQIR